MASGAQAVQRVGHSRHRSAWRAGGPPAGHRRASRAQHARVEKGEVDGIPATSRRPHLPRPGRDVPPDVLDDLLEEAEKDGTFDLPTSWPSASRGRKGSAALKRALLRYQPTGFTRSQLERRAIRLLAAAGIRPTGVNVWIPEAGVEVDLLFEPEGVAVEIDGAAVHGTTAAKIRDPDRDTRLQLSGLLLLRVPEYRLVHEPDVYVADVKRMLSRAGRTPARPGR